MHADVHQFLIWCYWVDRPTADMPGHGPEKEDLPWRRMTGSQKPWSCLTSSLLRSRRCSSIFYVASQLGQKKRLFLGRELLVQLNKLFLLPVGLLAGGFFFAGEQVLRGSAQGLGDLGKVLGVRSRLPTKPIADGIFFYSNRGCE